MAVRRKGWKSCCGCTFFSTGSTFHRTVDRPDGFLQQTAKFNTVGSSGAASRPKSIRQQARMASEIIERFYPPRVGQVEPVLKKVHPQHEFPTLSADGHCLPSDSTVRSVQAGATTAPLDSSPPGTARAAVTLWCFSNPVIAPNVFCLTASFVPFVSIRLLTREEHKQ